MADSGSFQKGGADWQWGGDTLVTQDGHWGTKKEGRGGWRMEEGRGKERDVKNERRKQKKRKEDGRVD